MIAESNKAIDSFKVNKANKARKPWTHLTGGVKVKASINEPKAHKINLFN